MNQAGGEAMNCDSRAARAVGLAKAEKTDDGTPVSSAAMLVGGAISAEREEMEDRMAEREGFACRLSTRSGDATARAQRPARVKNEACILTECFASNDCGEMYYY